jgi:hypothetical protein
VATCGQAKEGISGRTLHETKHHKVNANRDVRVNALPYSTTLEARNQPVTQGVVILQPYAGTAVLPRLTSNHLEAGGGIYIGLLSWQQGTVTVVRRDMEMVRKGKNEHVSWAREVGGSGQC